MSNNVDLDRSVAQDGPIYYTEILLSPSPENPRRLIFIADLNGPKPPDEVRALRQDFERLAHVVSVLFDKDQAQRSQLFGLIHQTADRGLRGSNTDVEDGKANLDAAREEVTEAALAVRDQRLLDYTQLALRWGFPFFVLGGFLLITNGFWIVSPPTSGQSYPTSYAWLVAACWIPAGAAFCVWGEFALRMQSGLTYETLLAMDPSRWQPKQRLLVTVGVAFIFAFLLAYDIIKIGVGTVMLNDFVTKSPALSLAVGGVTGLAFAAVRDAIFRVKPDEKK
jgi:hypothetical protein